jgi:hypothetical protein
VVRIVVSCARLLAFRALRIAITSIEWFVIEGETTRGNAWDDVSFASEIVTPTSFLPHDFHCFSTNTVNHSKVYNFYLYNINFP